MIFVSILLDKYDNLYPSHIHAGNSYILKYLWMFTNTHG
jgi:hypothetical protein